MFKESLTNLMDDIYSLASDTNINPEQAYLQILRRLSRASQQDQIEALTRLVIILARRGIYQKDSLEVK